MLVKVSHHKGFDSNHYDFSISDENSGSTLHFPNVDKSLLEQSIQELIDKLSEISSQIFLDSEEGESYYE